MLTHARRFRLLASEIEIRTDCSLVDRELSYLVPGAAQDYPVTHRFAFDISRDGDRYLISAEGEPVDSERSPNFVMFNLFSRVNGAAFSVMPAFIRLHSASGIYNGRRFLVVGDRAAGKTTLMLRLLYEGWDIQGDEMVMLRDGTAIAFPRRFHIKAGTIALLPRIAALIDRLPYVEYENGYRIASFDPAEEGFAWRLSAGEPAVVFFAEGNHGGRSRLSEPQKYLMVQQVMSQIIVPEEASWNWIGDLAATLDRARCYNLQLGDLDSAVLAMRNVLD